MPAESARFHESNLWATPIRDLGLTIEGLRSSRSSQEFEERAAPGRVSPGPAAVLPLHRVGRALRDRGHRHPLLPREPRARPRFTTSAPASSRARPRRHPALPAPRDGARRELRLPPLRATRSGSSSSAPSPSPTARSTGPSRSAGSYVRHLPGWYAQKHPDEDWAETFAVWMTPGLDWRREYAAGRWRSRSSSYCDRTMAELRDRDPMVTDDELDEDVGDVEYSLGHFYRDEAIGRGEAAARPRRRAALDLRGPRARRRRAGRAARARGSADPPAGPDLPANVYRWTGHFPEHTRALLAHLADRAEELRRSTRRPRGRGDRRGDDAGDRTGDEPRAAG